MTDIAYFDLETQLSAEEVGGWHNAGKMKVSVGVIYSTAEADFTVYVEEDAAKLADRLTETDLVVGFNVLGFDYKVLQPYTSVQLRSLPTVDMLDDLYRALGHRVSLDSCADATLGEGKTADGLAALRWWKEGRVDLITEYCKKDVDVTRRLYEYGCEHGQVYFLSRRGGRKRVSVPWTTDTS